MICYTCKIDKDHTAENFHSKKGKLKYQCKPCANQEGALWRAKNADYKKAYYEDNKLAEIERIRKWQQNNEDKFKSAGRLREYRKRSNGEYEPVSIEKVAIRDNYLCGVCSTSIDRLLLYPHPGSLSLDHIIPISKDGTHTYINVQASHLSCNIRKAAKLAHK